MKKTNPVEDFFPEEAAVGNTESILDSLAKDGAWNLGYDGMIGCNPGYIFRGEADWKVPLQSSLERCVRSNSENGLKGSDLRKTEREQIDKFIGGEGGKVAAIFYPNRTRLISDVRDDIFWWLSLMQHYGLPTRLVDFTRDIRIALYFAIEQAENANHDHRQSEDLIIYCFPCRDPKDQDDPDNNKTPVAPPGVDMNRALGTLIDLEWMKVHKRDEKRSKQRFGWDRPHYQNPRIESQLGMFVYPYDDPPESLTNNHLSWLVQNFDSSDPFNWHGSTLDPLPAKRIRVYKDRLPLLKKLLSDKYHLTPDTICERGSKIKLRVP